MNALRILIISYWQVVQANRQSVQDNNRHPSNISNYSYEAVYSYMSYSLQETRLPQTYGLFLNEKLIGMYQFTMEDLFSRPDIYPWLANVYIDKAYRSCGYGRFLLNSVKETAEKAGLSELYLFTTHEGLYEKFGWDFVREIDTFLEPRIQRLYRLNNGADDQKSNKTHDLRGDN